MSQLVRIYEIDRLLRGKRPPNKQELLKELEVSEATLKRDLDLMRDQLHAPIQWDREAGGYRYDPADFNLPGLWFNASEIHALLFMQSLLEQLQPGLVRDQLKPFAAKLRSFIDTHPLRTEAIRDHIRILNTPSRPVDPARFQAVCTAALERRRLRLRYYTRYRGREDERTVSPQRLIYYRGNWYLDAWCHDRRDLRRFAVDAIREARVLDQPASEVPPRPGDEGYGIFPGPAQETAVLRFDAIAARWVAEEEWHPRQTLRSLPEGEVILEVPYSHPQEILMDILRHGSHVEVLEPTSLRSAAVSAHQEAAAVYQRPKRPVAKAATSAGTAVAGGM